jgi:TolB protein
MRNKISVIGALIFLFLVQPNYAQEKDKHKIVFQSLAWSPDGKTIAFTAIKVKPDWSDYSADKWSLYLYNMESKVLEKLESGVLYFSFSHDGKKLAFDKRFEKNADIYIMDISTRKTIKLIDNETKDGGPSWSSDSKSIVFYSDRSGHEELYCQKVNKGKVKQLTKREEYKSFNPVCSPISDQVVYYLEKEDRKDQIYLTDLKGSFQTNLSNDLHHNIYPSWTPGGRIIYVRDKGGIMIMNSDGSGKERLCDIASEQVRMSPNGEFLLISKNDGNLYRVKLNNKTEELILCMKD